MRNSTNPNASNRLASDSLPQMHANFVSQLTADAMQLNQPRQVLSAHFSWVKPTFFPKPQLIALNDTLASTLKLNHVDEQTLAQVLTGQQLFPGSKPYAMCYGGHQFGQWAGQLGDGRAINLGELEGTDRQRYSIQLKGAGRTPYSRQGDGLAVLRSSIREYLCSEAMHALGIPTTRALSLCLTGEQVLRDMFYDGNAKLEPGAIVCRVSPSFVRFGHIQLFSARQEFGLLQQLLDVVISSHFPELLQQYHEPAQRYLAWFKQVCANSIALMVQWYRVGFVHGVMNTDNMSVLGETIDYGPYGWLDEFDEQFTPNTSDIHQRYCFGAQAAVCQWNLYQLANALYPLIPDEDALTQPLAEFHHVYQAQWLAMMAEKLGLPPAETSASKRSQAKLIQQLIELLSLGKLDMTLFYRQLAACDLSSHQHLGMLNHLAHTSYSSVEWKKIEPLLSDWLMLYRQQIAQQQVTEQQRKATMNAVNPAFILRNYLVQQAIEQAEQGNYQEIIKLQQLLKTPYHLSEPDQHYGEKRPAWAKNKAGCSRLSCSS
jgi:uncharacterized protein YdiU (UPF0061 family)